LCERKNILHCSHGITIGFKPHQAWYLG
jgi:hypothetical protein